MTCQYQASAINQTTRKIGGATVEKPRSIPPWSLRSHHPFVRWFRESRVVDEDGLPLPVYHGTPTGGFSEFDPDKLGSRDSGLLGNGFYFAKDKETAKSFTATRIRDMQKGKKMVYQVYLRVENPMILSELTLEDIERGWNAFRTRFGRPPATHAEFLEKAKPIIRAKQEGNMIAFARELCHLISPATLARMLGHDGIFADFEGGTIVVFDPCQIKAVDNAGGFCAENPNIYT